MRRYRLRGAERFNPPPAFLVGYYRTTQSDAALYKTNGHVCIPSYRTECHCCAKRIQTAAGTDQTTQECRPVPFRQRDKAAAISHETVDVAVHPPRRGRPERTRSQAFRRLCRACKKSQEYFRANGNSNRQREPNNPTQARNGNSK